MVAGAFAVPVLFAAVHGKLLWLSVQKVFNIKCPGRFLWWEGGLNNQLPGPPLME